MLDLHKKILLAIENLKPSSEDVYFLSSDACFFFFFSFLVYTQAFLI